MARSRSGPRGRRVLRERVPGKACRPALASPADNPSTKRGQEITVEFTLLGQSFVGLNGGSRFSPNEAVSFQVFTDMQEETDRYWNAIVGNGGAESMCGWCKDRWGVKQRAKVSSFWSAPLGVDRIKPPF